MKPIPWDRKRKSWRAGTDTGTNLPFAGNPSCLMVSKPVVLCRAWYIQAWNGFGLLLVAALVLCASTAGRGWAATDVASSNRPPRLVVAVLPFENATGDAALDDWRQVLPALVRSCLGGAEFTSVPGWKKIQPSLVRAGWIDVKAVDAALACQVARELKANFAVWGSFRRQTNRWAVDAKVLPADADAAVQDIRLTELNPVKLAESLALRLVEQWGRPVSQDQQKHWRMSVTEADPAANMLAHAVALELRKAPAVEQEQAWREVLVSDPGCGMAYSAMINLLADTRRNAEIGKLVEEFIRQQPRSCVAHVANSVRLLVGDDVAGAETELH